MSVPQDPEGEQLAAIVEIMGAISVIDRQVLKFEPGSRESKFLLKARKNLTRVAGKFEHETEDMPPALMKMYLSQLLGPAQPPKAPAGQPPGAQPAGPGAQPLGPGAPLGGMAPA